MNASKSYVDSFRLSEQHIYGSARLGIYNQYLPLAYRYFNATASGNELNAQVDISISISTISYSLFSVERGKKSYELSNHLGNVLTVISDKRLITCQSDTIAYYSAEIISATDYSPFGAPLPRRTFSGEGYRFRFNGKESDNEVKGLGNSLDFGSRSIYDGRLARFVSIDPRYRDYPSMSPYVYAANCPIVCIDEDGEGPRPTIRLIFHGGAREKNNNGNINKIGLAHNDAFKHAALNVMNDYGVVKGIKIELIKLMTGKQLVDKINSQMDNSIASLDIVSHGGAFSITTSQNDNRNSGLYDDPLGKASTEAYFGSDYKFDKDSRSIDDIKFSKFTNDAIIELHGCLTGTQTVLVDNIAEDLSERLYSAGKKNAVVIAHREKANPNIDGEGTTTKKNQDYRHGSRVVYHNGSVLFETSQRGRITQRQINKALKEKNKK